MSVLQKKLLYNLVKDLKKKSHLATSLAVGKV